VLEARTIELVLEINPLAQGGAAQFRRQDILLTANNL